MDLREKGKREAAVLAVNKYVKDNDIVGIGSGSTIVYAVERLAERVRSEQLRVQCVTTSFQSQQLLAKYELTETTLDLHPRLSVAIDGADEVDAGGNCIKGGGGCMTREKIVAAAADQFIVIADVSKKSPYLGKVWTKGIPLEVIPMARVPVCRTIEQQLGGTTVLRMAKHKAGPVVTDNGNLIVDWKFPPRSPDNPYDWNAVNIQLTMIPGVCETGLFVNMFKHVIFGGEDGAEEY